MWTLDFAPRAKPSKKSVTSSVWRSPTRGDVDKGFDGVGGAAGEVDGGDGEGLVHGHDEVAGAEDAALVAEGLHSEGLAESDAGVFDGVVLVDVEVALNGLEGRGRSRRGG